MAYRYRYGQTDVADAFRNNHYLQQFMLNGVTPTGRRLGTGSYGSVKEVSSSTVDFNFKVFNQYLNHR